MPLPLVRRPLLHVALGVSLAAASAAVVAPAAAPVTAVVSYDGAVPDVPGVRVLRELPAVEALVVRGTPHAVARLAGVPGVRGVAPDVPVAFTNGGGSHARAVRAADGLAAPAGQRGAGHGVRVAVVDTGVSDTPALNRRSGRLVDAVDTSTRGAQGPLTDTYGHGTFMASVIAGGSVDGRSRPVGVAPGATVLVVRVAEADGSTRLSQVVAGLDWVAGNADRVDVANLSLSYRRPGAGYGADPLTDAVEAVRDAGVSVVVSAGNDPTLVGDPGFAPRALTVGAADLTARTPQVAPFSGSDVVAGVRKPDVVASGVAVLGVLPPTSTIAKQNPESRVDGRLWRGSGTSQATAVTSGAVALLLQRDPGAGPTEVKAALRTAATPLDGDRDGAGLLRVALQGVDGSADPRADGHGDPSGEAGWDANSWSANSWSANSWSANSWSANSWSANSWSANSWSSTWASGR